MNTYFFEEIFLDQKKNEVAAFDCASYCARPEENQLDLTSSLAQVVLGVRRCGKSTLCMNTLKKSGQCFGYANFDDERLSKITGEDLNTLLLALYKVYGEFKILFLDEMQNIPEWFLFANRLLRQGMHLVITGSNAKLLSGELTTHLTGRYKEIRLLPFSFEEFCFCKHVNTILPSTTLDTAKRSAAFDEYLQLGGFPELLREKDSVSYVNSLVESIVQRDIVQRHHVRHVRELSELTNHLLNIVPTKCNTFEYSKLLNLKSNNTTKKYLSYLEQAYLILRIQKYSTKSAIRLVNEKIYPIDVTLMNCRENAFAGANKGWRLEVLVYLELRRRFLPQGYDIYYYSERTTEADFLVCKGRHVEEIIQVAYDIDSSKVRKRELRGAQAAAQATGCAKLTLVTIASREDATTPDGHTISIVPAHEWFCMK